MKEILAATVLLVPFLFFGLTSAQAPPQVILTWAANNFYPSDYPGKALATPNASVSVAAEVLRNGKLLDLSAADFTWFADEKTVGRGRGLKETSFVAEKTAGNDVFVRVIIEIGEETLENSLRIPIESPVVVIETPLPNRKIAAGETVTLESIPYFFNISSLFDLKFLWQINDVRKESDGENSIVLNVGSPQAEDQKTIRITSLVRNKRNPLEFWSEKIELKVF